MPFIPPFSSLNTTSLKTRSDAPAASTDNVSSWRLEPDGRGTFGILRSCIITLALCVYTAIHLNIPAATDKKRDIYLRKAKWVAIAMLAPEFIVYVAWTQRQKVLEIHHKVNEGIKKHQSRDSTQKRKHPWTMTHSWYAYMGGFVIDTTPKPHEDLIIEGSPKITLRKYALFLLASKGWLPDLHKGDIEDKSKADGFAKLFAIVQSAWMLLQCIMRWSWGLHVTGLELNTLAHAVCALSIFGLWWDKPMDIQHPTVLQAEWTQPFAAYLWISRLPILFLPKDVRRPAKTTTGLDGAAITKNWDGTGIESLWWFLVDPSTLPPDSLQEPATQTMAWTAMSVFSTDKVPTDEVRIFNWESGQYSSRTFSGSPSTGGLVTLSLTSTELVVLPSFAIGFGARLPESEKLKPFEIDRALIVRWKIVWDWLHALQQDDASDKTFPPPAVDSGMTPLLRFRRARISEHHYDLWGCIQFRVNNFNGQEATTDENTLMSLFVFVICAVAYGGIHAAHWSHHFSSAIEQILWKVSCIYIPSFGIASFPIFLVWYAIERRHDRSELDSRLKAFVHIFYRSGEGENLHYWPWVLLAGIFLVAYLVARLYLVVEAFITLRSVPESAYRTPDWTQYLPHL
ncbi:hypothetical protein QBC44DRAFT_382505 [Cladorrhinum sp. PSN332]|nr:hypothetical protein QBC44DRAFT_382505 [Cladorrhinum sp. PSN332]